MRIKTLIFIAVIACSVIITPVTAGEQEAVKNMANILLGLNHFPSDAEKDQLSNIINTNDSEDVKAIATAIKNMHHSASDSDKAKLKTVMDNDAASANVKSLASIVYDLTHKPSSDDKKALSGMINFASDM